LLFRKRGKRNPQAHLRSASRASADVARAAGPDQDADRRGLYRIDFDMMTKGAVVKRRGKRLRQVGVTVNGSTRLVTSGDVVDRETYEALLAVGAIRVPPPPTPPTPPAPEHESDGAPVAPSSTGE